MITKIKLENFLSFREAEIELKPLTVLIGPVGGGKSNLLKALIYLKRLTLNELFEIFVTGPSDFQWVLHRNANPEDPIGFEVELEDLEGFSGERAKYRIQMRSSEKGVYINHEELIRIEANGKESFAFQRDDKGGKILNYTIGPNNPSILNFCRRQFYDPSEKRQPIEFSWLEGKGLKAIEETDKDIKLILGIARSLENWYYHLEATNLKDSGSGHNQDILETYGKRFPDFLSWLRTVDYGDTIFDQIKNDLEEILPGFKDLIITQADLGKQIVAMSFKNQRGIMTSQNLSDGTMFVLGLLSIAYHPFKPKTICIEEPETGLHPRLMRWLFDRLMEISDPEEGNKSQVIISTHSPYFLDLFKENQDSVLVVEQREGSSIVTPLPKILSLLEHTKNGKESFPLGYEWASGLFEGLFA